MLIVSNATLVSLRIVGGVGVANDQKSLSPLVAFILREILNQR